MGVDVEAFQKVAAFVVFADAGKWPKSIASWLLTVPPGAGKREGDEGNCFHRLHRCQALAGSVVLAGAGGAANNAGGNVGGHQLGAAKSC